MTRLPSHYLLRPDWLPAVALSAALAAAMLAWDPHVGDLAAQVFRTELFQRAGLGIWNGSWYGGHYTLTYSVLFPPLAALLGPRLVGTFAVVASSYLFDRLVRDRWGEAARWATLWFAAGVVTLLADGQLTFALGVAFALAAMRALQLHHTPWALLASAACALSSPVAAVSLAGVLLAAALDPAVYLNRLSRGWRGGGARPGAASSFSPRRLSESGDVTWRKTQRLDGHPLARQDPRADRSVGRLPRAGAGHRPQPRLPRRRPVPLRLLLLHGDPAVVRRRADRHPRPRRRGASASPRPARLPAGGDGALAGAEPARRQRGPPRRAVRRAGAGGGRPRPPPAARRPPGSRPRGHPGGRSVLAGHRERQSDRPLGRRPVDERRLLRPGVRLAARPRRPRRADRGAADRQPLGGRLPGAGLRTRTRLAAPARHHARRHLLRRRQAARRTLLPRLAAQQRDPLRRPARRARSTTPRSPRAA